MYLSFGPVLFTDFWKNLFSGKIFFVLKYSDKSSSFPGIEPLGRGGLLPSIHIGNKREELIGF